VCRLEERDGEQVEGQMVRGRVRSEAGGSLLRPWGGNHRVRIAVYLYAGFLEVVGEEGRMAVRKEGWGERRM